MSAPRLCGCGCGESIDHKRRGALYLNDTHGQRVYDKNAKARRDAPSQAPTYRGRRLSRAERREELRSALLEIKGAQDALAELRGQRSRVENMVRVSWSPEPEAPTGDLSRTWADTFHLRGPESAPGRDGVRVFERSPATGRTERFEEGDPLSSAVHDKEEKDYAKEQASLYATIARGKSRIVDLFSAPLAGEGTAPPLLSPAAAKWLGLGDFAVRIEPEPTKAQRAETEEVTRVAGFPAPSRREFTAPAEETRRREKKDSGLRGGSPLLPTYERRRAAAKQALAEAGPRQRARPVVVDLGAWREPAPPLIWVERPLEAVA